MDIAFLEKQAQALAAHVAKEAPPSISAVIIMLDMENGNIVARAPRMPAGLYREVLRALMDKPVPGEVIA